MKFYPQKITHSLALIVLLLFSVVIRLILIFNGGERLHDDGPEFFGHSKNLYKHLVLHDWNGFFSTKVFGHWGGAMLGSMAFFITSPWLTPAQIYTIFFAIPSIVNIYLLFRIALLFGGSQKTALIAAGLYTLSFSGFYQVQHGLYYDFSLLFFLLGIIFTLKAKHNKSALLLSGLFYFLCFFSYYGYWTVSFGGMLFLAYHNKKNLNDFFIRGLIGASGFLIPLGLFFLIGYKYGVNYFQHFLKFSQTITHGNFEQGHEIPFLFLWNAEGLLSLVWLSCLLVSFFYKKEYAIKCSLIAILLIYGLWISGSNLFESFVVYGRLVKSIVPLLCLNTAFVMSSINTRSLLVIFILLIPNPLINAWRNWPPTYFQDITKYERALRKTQGNDRIIKLTTRCIPDNPACHGLFPYLPGDDCLIEKSYPSKFNLGFNQYDGITRDSRDILKEHFLIVEVNNCLKPDSP